MASEYIFYDYVDADGGEGNIVNNWLNGQGQLAKAHFNRIIDYLGNSPPAGSQDSVWQRPYVWPLRGKWKGFKELRKKVKGVQYRLIIKVEGRNVFIITWGFHRDSWITDITPQTGTERAERMSNNPERYRKEHDFS